MAIFWMKPIRDIFFYKIAVELIQDLKKTVRYFFFLEIFDCFLFFKTMENYYSFNSEI